MLVLGSILTHTGYITMAIYPLTMAGLVLLPKQCSHMPDLTNCLPASAQRRAGRGGVCRPRVPNNGNLPCDYGRTSPPTKTIFTCELINLCLWPRYLVTSDGNLLYNYGRTSPPAKIIFICESINLCLWSRYLVMAIYPMTMIGLVPLPKQCSHVN